MFTGIVEEVGRVAAIEHHEGRTVLTVKAKTVLEGTRIGDSIAVNGTCLTVTALTPTTFTVEMVLETLRRTNLGDLTVGSPVNLERSLTPHSRMGGHFVQGHIDGTGEVRHIRPEGDSRVVTFSAPDNVLPFVVPKGFIAVDGISLTVVDRLEDGFTVAFIPHTLAHTIAGNYREGTRVNLEADILGKYVANIVQHYTTPT